MATWTAPPTFTSTTLTAATLNQLIGSGGNLDWLKNALSTIGITADSGLQSVESAMCGARVYNNANISVANNAWTALTFNSERWDLFDGAASTFHSTSSNTGRITIPSGLDGYYLIGGNVEFASNATNRRGIRIVHSVGATVIGTFISNASGTDHSLSVTSLWPLAAAEYVTLEVFQNSGGALNAQSTAAYSPELWAIRLAV
ncbi:MAG TPA: hypothetical protein VFJ93_07680 [Gaiellaceae bacterium]|nr:hypothetical protein [Gaiellaceae bacterium]